MSVINLVVSKQEKTRVKISFHVLKDRTDNNLQAIGLTTSNTDGFLLDSWVALWRDPDTRVRVGINFVLKKFSTSLQKTK